MLLQAQTHVDQAGHYYSVFRSHLARRFSDFDWLNLLRGLITPIFKTLPRKLSMQYREIKNLFAFQEFDRLPSKALKKIAVR